MDKQEEEPGFGEEAQQEPPFYSTALQGNLTKRRKEELNEIYTAAGKSRKGKRIGSPGYLRGTKSSRRKS